MRTEFHGEIGLGEKSSSLANTRRDRSPLAGDPKPSPARNSKQSVAKKQAKNCAALTFSSGLRCCATRFGNLSLDPLPRILYIDANVETAHNNNVEQ